MRVLEGSTMLRLALADALDVVADAVIMLGEDQRILFFNQGAEHIFGFRPQEVLGQPVERLLPPCLASAHHEHVRAFSAAPEAARRMGDPLSVRGRRCDGTEFPAEVTISKLERNGETVFTVIVRDVTDRLEADKVLRQWMHIFEHAEWGIVVGRAEGNTLEMMNPTFAQMHGYTVEELTGRPLGDVFAPCVSDQIHDRVRMAHGEGHYAYESQHTRKDGSVFPVWVDVTNVKDEADQTLYRVINVQDITERKRAETALRESEELYRSMITAMQEGVVFHDAEGRINACNSSAERILGLSLDQMVGRTSLDPRWRAIYEDGSPFPGDQHPAMVTLRTGQPQSDVIMGVHKPDGTLTWISINSQPVFRRDEPGRYAVVASFTDISGRKLAEQSLRESEERYRLLYDNSLDGILLTAPDGNVLAANPAACRMFGRTEEQICRVGRSGLVDLSDPRLAVALEERADTGRFRSEMFLMRQDGTRFSGEVTSNVFKDKEGQLLTSMIIRDITRRKQAEEALRESEARLRVLVEQTPAVLWTTDTQLQFTSAQGAGMAALGVRPDQVLGSLVSEFGPFDDPDMSVMVDAHRRALQGEPLTYETQWRDRTFQSHVEPLRNAEGLIVGCIGVALDITERVQAYQLLEQRVQERTQELSALLEVSRNVASMLDLEPLLTLILTQLKRVVDYTGAALAILENDKLVIVDYCGPLPRKQMLNFQTPVNQDSGYGRVVLHREPVIISDIWEDTPWLRDVRGLAGEERLALFGDIHSWMGVPLIAKDNLIGVLRLDHVEPDHFTEQHARLALAFAEQAAVTIENARLYKQAQQLSALEERQRLARELHDSVSQALYSIALGARTARTLLDRDPRKAAEPLDYVRSLAEAGLAEMRAMIFELRPDSLEEEGLVAALVKQTEALRARHGIEVQVGFCDEPSMSIGVREALYRIAQEALHNIVKHARASRVDLDLTCGEAAIVLQVKDNGLGFDASKPFPGHLGLRSMRERAERVGGTFELESAPGRGTVIQVRIPK